MYKRTYYRIKTTQLDTDSGWLSEDIQTSYIKQLDTIKNEIDLSTSVSGLVYSITFESPKLGDYYTRKYVKLQAVLANIGGILNIFAVGFTILCSSVSETSLFLQEAKDLVNFFNIYKENEEEEQLESEKVQDKGSNKITIITFNSQTKQASSEPSNSTTALRNPSNRLNSMFSILPLEVIESNTNKDKESEEAKSEEVNIRKYSEEVGKNIGYCDYAKRQLDCRKKSKYKQVFYDSITGFLKKKLDICSAIKLSHHFDILKTILFGSIDDKDNLKKDIFSFKIPITEIIKYHKQVEKESKFELIDVDQSKELSEQRLALERIIEVKERLLSKGVFRT